MQCCSIAVRNWALLLVAVGASIVGLARLEFSRVPAAEVVRQGGALQPFLAQYCLDCHNPKDKAGGLDFDAIKSHDLATDAKTWEQAVRKLTARQMPPPEAARPDEKTYNTMISTLAGALDAAAAEHPNPGRTETIRRLDRTEYQNAIRDLLALEIDSTALLPADQPSHGLDNLLLSDLPPTLLDRYVTAAQKISRLAVGNPLKAPSVETFRVPADITQEEQVEGLPDGTRGGTLIDYNFPQDGKYDIQVWLMRDRNEHIEGLTEPHELELLLDKQQVASFAIAPPEDHEGRSNVDDNLKTRITATAGPHQLGVTFLKNPSSLLETKRQPYEAHFNMHRHPRISPAIFQVCITGPYEPQGHGDTPSRRKIFICQPTAAAEEEHCAQKILETLAHRAYRRPVSDADLESPMKFYRQARAEGDFDSGIEAALSSILVNPKFLFRVERDPENIAPNTAYRISDLELASRLSFFLWSSIPDGELLDLAERNQLSKPEVLAAQTQRMLVDQRANNLATNFAAQWLNLRNLESVTPDLRLYPDFDDNLRQAFRQETELFFTSIMRENRSVLDLLHADYTFLNERLAKHYGIPHIYGSRFRRVELDADSQRGGLLRQGSILTVTSYATRTSPVIRGKWILENLLGSPPPRPPANVPSLKDNTVSDALSVRNRLAEHRANAACAACHKAIDPVGFSLEQFDAVGRWRTLEEGQPIDAHGGLPDGAEFEGVAGLEQALLRRPELFERTLTEKLLAFALGRELDYFDAPAVRKIVRETSANENKFSSLIQSIVASTPFQMRRSP
jgi:mono/diheme cytochrome c family protein